MTESSVWRIGGSIAINEDGKVMLSDKCPCGALIWDISVTAGQTYSFNINYPSTAEKPAVAHILWGDEEPEPGETEWAKAEKVEYYNGPDYVRMWAPYTGDATYEYHAAMAARYGYERNTAANWHSVYHTYLTSGTMRIRVSGQVASFGHYAEYRGFPIRVVTLDLDTYKGSKESDGTLCLFGFNECTNLSEISSGCTFGKNFCSGHRMFYGCSGLTDVNDLIFPEEAPGYFNCALMFYACINLHTLPALVFPSKVGFDPDQPNGMFSTYSMFVDCMQFTSPISITFPDEVGLGVQSPLCHFSCYQMFYAYMLGGPDGDYDAPKSYTDLATLIFPSSVGGSFYCSEMFSIACWLKDILFSNLVFPSAVGISSYCTTAVFAARSMFLGIKLYKVDTLPTNADIEIFLPTTLATGPLVYTTGFSFSLGRFDQSINEHDTFHVRNASLVIPYVPITPGFTVFDTNGRVNLDFCFVSVNLTHTGTFTLAFTNDYIDSIRVTHALYGTLMSASAVTIDFPSTVSNIEANYMLSRCPVKTFPSFTFPKYVAPNRPDLDERQFFGNYWFDRYLSSSGIEDIPEGVLTFDADAPIKQFSLNSMFSGCVGLAIPVPNMIFPAQPIERFDVGSMFSGCANLTGFEYPLVFPSTVTDTFSSHYMFYRCPGIVGDMLQVTFPTSVVNTFSSSYMFSDCTGIQGLVGDIVFPAYINSNFSANWMYGGCRGLTEVTSIIFPLEVGGRCNVQSMFNGCIGLQQIPAIKFPNKVGYTEYLPYEGALVQGDFISENMFNACPALSSDISVEFPSEVGLTVQSYLCDFNCKNMFNGGSGGSNLVKLKFPTAVGGQFSCYGMFSFKLNSIQITTLEFPTQVSISSFCKYASFDARRVFFISSAIATTITAAFEVKLPTQFATAGTHLGAAFAFDLGRLDDMLGYPYPTLTKYASCYITNTELVVPRIPIIQPTSSEYPRFLSSSHVRVLLELAFSRWSFSAASFTLRFEDEYIDTLRVKGMFSYTTLPTDVTVYFPDTVTGFNAENMFSRSTLHSHPFSSFPTYVPLPYEILFTPDGYNTYNLRGMFGYSDISDSLSSISFTHTATIPNLDCSALYLECKSLPSICQSITFPSTIGIRFSSEKMYSGCSGVSGSIPVVSFPQEIEHYSGAFSTERMFEGTSATGGVPTTTFPQTVGAHFNFNCARMYTNNPNLTGSIENIVFPAAWKFSCSAMFMGGRFTGSFPIIAWSESESAMDYLFCSNMFASCYYLTSLTQITFPQVYVRDFRCDSMFYECREMTGTISVTFPPECYSFYIYCMYRNNSAMHVTSIGAITIPAIGWTESFSGNNTMIYAQVTRSHPPYLSTISGSQWDHAGVEPYPDPYVEGGHHVLVTIGSSAEYSYDYYKLNEGYPCHDLPYPDAGECAANYYYRCSNWLPTGTVPGKDKGFDLRSSITFYGCSNCASAGYPVPENWSC